MNSGGLASTTEGEKLILAFFVTDISPDFVPMPNQGECHILELRFKIKVTYKGVQEDLPQDEISTLYSIQDRNFSPCFKSVEEGMSVTSDRPSFDYLRKVNKFNSNIVQYDGSYLYAYSFYLYKRIKGEAYEKAIGHHRHQSPPPSHLYYRRVYSVISRRPYHKFFNEFVSRLEVSIHRDKTVAPADIWEQLSRVDVAGNVKMFGLSPPVLPTRTSDLPFFNLDAELIFESLSLRDVLTVFNAIMQERDVIFFSSNMLKVFNTIQVFMRLLYPFKYISTLAATLPSYVHQYLDVPTTSIFGIHRDLFYRKIHKIQKNYVVVDLDNGAVGVFRGHGRRKLHELPESMYRHLRQGLKQFDTVERDARPGDGIIEPIECYRSKEDACISIETPFLYSRYHGRRLSETPNSSESDEYSGLSGSVVDETETSKQIRRVFLTAFACLFENIFQNTHLSKPENVLKFDKKRYLNKDSTRDAVYYLKTFFFKTMIFSGFFDYLYRDRHENEYFLRQILKLKEDRREQYEVLRKHTKFFNVTVFEKQRKKWVRHSNLILKFIYKRDVMAFVTNSAARKVAKCSDVRQRAVKYEKMATILIHMDRLDNSSICFPRGGNEDFSKIKKKYLGNFFMEICYPERRFLVMHPSKDEIKLMYLIIRVAISTLRMEAEVRTVNNWRTTINKRRWRSGKYGRLSTRTIRNTYKFYSRFMGKIFDGSQENEESFKSSTNTRMAPETGSIESDVVTEVTVDDVSD